jgi:hypothetical protein
VTGQTPKLLIRPRLPHQNFADFSKCLENSKTAELINNTPNNPGISLVSKNCDVVVVKLRVKRLSSLSLWAVPILADRSCRGY